MTLHHRLTDLFDYSSTRLTKSYSYMAPSNPPIQLEILPHGTNPNGISPDLAFADSFCRCRRCKGARTFVPIIYCSFVTKLARELSLNIVFKQAASFDFKLHAALMADSKKKESVHGIMGTLATLLAASSLRL